MAVYLDDGTKDNKEEKKSAKRGLWLKKKKWRKKETKEIELIDNPAFDDNDDGVVKDGAEWKVYAIRNKSHKTANFSIKSPLIFTSFPTQHILPPFPVFPALLLRLKSHFIAKCLK